VHSRQHRFHVAGIETVVKVLKKFCVTGHRVLLPVPARQGYFAHAAAG
jgi:hypothetical protein